MKRVVAILVVVIGSIFLIINYYENKSETEKHNLSENTCQENAYLLIDKNRDLITNKYEKIITLLKENVNPHGRSEFVPKKQLSLSICIDSLNPEYGALKDITKNNVILQDIEYYQRYKKMGYCKCNVENMYNKINDKSAIVNDCDEVEENIDLLKEVKYLMIEELVYEQSPKFVSDKEYTTGIIVKKLSVIDIATHQLLFSEYLYAMSSNQITVFDGKIKDRVMDDLKGNFAKRLTQVIEKNKKYY